MKIYSSNLKLWILLSTIPIVVMIGVYLYGNYYLDSDIIKESDALVDQSTVIDATPFEERKVDVVQRVTNEMTLPKNEIKQVQTTSKEDKRLLDESGNMVTIEVLADETLEDIAEKRLGDKSFWVFLFDVNRDKLNKPTDLKPDMKLYVPNPEYFGFSAQDQASVQYARRRAEEINSKQQ